MLEVKQLNVSYGASQALYDVDFHADLGEISCVLGRNGVGKTSLVRAIAGRHIASSGQILWNTAEIRELDPAARAQQGIAYVPQGREIFARLTVAENLEIAFAAAPKGQRFIPDEIFALFPVLEQMLSRRGGDLSGGQQQQLAIARALITRPKLLILDEPTEGIQPSIIKDIGRVLSLLRERGDMAIVLVEQYLDFALDLCDRLCVLDRGRVKLAGQAQEVDQAAVRGLVTV
ncbi:urea ABC transporter ATP-binding subunit UrtE [Litoricola sp.]|nr:urea ABC transporter ATP-binding subunit UrtE [Litorivicinus sp.]|tara:strand:- start:281 stop:976 length:696 start_codon:yes stop_codon:yes gene_type:complete